MSLVLGNYDNSQSGNAIEPGMYEGIIESVRLVEVNGVPKVTESGKNQVDAIIRVDRDTSLRRRLTVSFGQNQSNGQWAALAKFIEAATGIKCGDKAQRTVTDADLIGKVVRMVVEVNDRGYNDITSFMPPPARKAQATPQPSGLSRPAQVQDDNDVPFFDEHGNRI